MQILALALGFWEAFPDRAKFKREPPRRVYQRMREDAFETATRMYSVLGGPACQPACRFVRHTVGPALISRIGKAPCNTQPKYSPVPLADLAGDYSSHIPGELLIITGTTLVVNLPALHGRHADILPFSARGTSSFPAMCIHRGG